MLKQLQQLRLTLVQWDIWFCKEFGVLSKEQSRPIPQMIGGRDKHKRKTFDHHVTKHECGYKIQINKDKTLNNEGGF
jgi:hypothetical protein